MKATQGHVTLVGAGPGDPLLLTLKGAEAIQRADVVIYDHLVSPQIVALSAPSAKRIYVGKAHDDRATPQPRIHRLLIRYARMGRRVVRLKGGDPFLFGRGGEEAQALAEARIPYDVIPGITSAFAVPAYAGIPVTHREVASSVAVLTGHENLAKSQTAIRWDHLATATDTLVCLMGVRTLPNLVAQLLQHGRAGDTPCAVIEQGTLPTQRTIEGTLKTIVGRCHDAQVRAPAVIVIGDVVRLRTALQWVERKPLFGRRIVVTRPSDRADELTTRLIHAGADVVRLPAIQPAPIHTSGLFHRAMQHIDRFDWVFFTSPEGIAWFRKLLVPLRKDVRILAGRHIGAIGPKTAAAIEQCGIHVDFVPEAFSQEGMLKDLRRRRITGTRGLILNAVGSREVLEEGLKALGMEVVRIPIYRSVMPEAFIGDVQQAFRQPVDLVTVTSASCVTHVMQAMRASGLARLIRSVPFASIGPVTSARVREHGGRVAVEAKVSTMEGLLKAMEATCRIR